MGVKWFQWPPAAQNWGNSPKYAIGSRLYALKVLPKRTVTLTDINWKHVVLWLNQLSCYVLHSGWREAPRHSSQINIQFTFKAMLALQLYSRTQLRLWQQVFIIADNTNLSYRPIIASILTFSVKWVYLSKLFDQKLLFWISALHGVKRIFQDWCVCVCVRALARAREYHKFANALP
jgi:hypothetical protein